MRLILRRNRSAWINGQKLPKQFHFIDYGVLDYDGIAQFQQFDGVQFSTKITGSQSNKIVELKVFRLATIMKNLNHLRIDLIKINIEGGEYAVHCRLSRFKYQCATNSGGIPSPFARVFLAADQAGS